MNDRYNLKNGFTRRQLLKYGFYGGLLTGLGSKLLISGCSGKKTPIAKRPNIILVLIDTLRADRLGCYGCSGGYTPTLDSIAEESTIFDFAIAQASWTQPSIASLFSSYYPSVHKVLKWEKTVKSGRVTGAKLAVLGNSFVTLAEVLQKVGYQTGAFVANPFVTESHGFAQGFEHFDSSFANNTTSGRTVNEAALAWLNNRASDKPFFCYLHYMDVHGPYKARAELLEPLLDKVESQPNKRKLSEREIKDLHYLYTFPKDGSNLKRHEQLSVYREYWEARYDGGVREIDGHIKNLNVRLEEMGLWKDAYFILTSDHGEAFLEHGYWDHGHGLHHPELHVPLLLRWPGVLSPGKRIHKPVQLIDLMPTMIDQLALPNVKGIQGSSLMDFIAGDGKSAGPATAFAEGNKEPEQQVIYHGYWKLIESKLKKNRLPLELYNLEYDRLEQNELSKTHPDKVKMLSKILENQAEINKRLGGKIWTGKVSLTPEEIQRLRSLGYLK